MGARRAILSALVSDSVPNNCWIFLISNQKLLPSCFLLPMLILHTVNPSVFFENTFFFFFLSVELSQGLCSCMGIRAMLQAVPSAWIYKITSWLVLRRWPSLGFKAVSSRVAVCLSVPMCCFTSLSLARILFPSFFPVLNFHLMRNWEVRLHQASGRAEVTFCWALLPLGCPDVLCGRGACCTVSCCGLWFFSLLICLVAGNLQRDRNVTKWDVLHRLSLTSWSVLQGSST